MKLIENPTMKEKRHVFNLDNLLKSDRTWSQDMQAQEGVISLLQKSLDSRYFLLRNVLLEGLEIPIPLVMVGPPGIRVLYVSGIRGVFRARDEYWEKMDEKTQNYRPSQPNLITRTMLMGRAVDTYLASHAENIPVSEPVLMFSDPGIYVEMSHPPVRIVLMDAMEHFITSLVQSRPLLIPQQIQTVIALLSSSMNLPESAEDSLPQIRDAFSMKDDEKPKKQLPALNVSLPDDEAAMKLVKKVPITNKQWIILGIMMLVNIVLIVGFVFLILLNT